MKLRRRRARRAIGNGTVSAIGNSTDDSADDATSMGGDGMEMNGGSRMRRVVKNNMVGAGLSNLATLLPATNELLYYVGLQRRRSRALRTAQAAGLFGAGALVGTGIAMLLTPKSGPQVRRELGERARSMKEYVSSEEETHKPAHL